jgi:hypothetical protein
VGLADVVRNAVAIAHQVVGDLEVSVVHEPYLRQDGYKKPVYGAGVNRTGLLMFDTKMVTDETGQEKVSDAQLTFLEPITVDTRDRMTLADGKRPKILAVRGFADAGRDGAFVTEVAFGGARSSV